MSKFTLFWRGPFSQWHPSKFSFMGRKFNCAEQVMMLGKAALFGDDERAGRIMESSSPKEQKALGRQVEGFDPKKWDEVARDIVYFGSWHKFTQNPELCKELVNTYPTTLVEASPYDRVWGIGLGEGDPDALDPEKWAGKNWLGEVLTKCRTDIMAGRGMDWKANCIAHSLFTSWFGE